MAARRECLDQLPEAHQTMASFGMSVGRSSRATKNESSRSAVRVRQTIPPPNRLGLSTQVSHLTPRG